MEANNFDFNKINDFDEHIDKSIPSYNLLVEMTKSIAEYFYTKESVIYDLGCSTGKMLSEIKSVSKKRGIDNSDLLPKADPNFESIDLNKEDIVFNACVVFSLFTMQFLNVNRRYSYINGIYKGLISGGALLISEKVYQDSGRAQEVMTFSHYEMKMRSFSASAILDKEKSLRQVMKPMEQQDFEQLLKEVGFRTVTPYWQCFNFKAYLCIK
jgi:tRNA (cmo5U34)-methyltransferase